MDGMVPEVTLNFDLWYAICEELFRNERRQDLATLCLVSRQKNAAAIPWLYRCVTLDFSMVKDPLRCFNNTKELHSRLIQSLAVQGLDISKHDIEFRMLVEVIPRLSNLQRFLWKSAELIPTRLMRAVQAHPRAREIVVEPCLFVNGRDSTYTFDPNRTLLLAKSAPEFDSIGLTPVKRVVDIRVNLDDFYLAGYRFPPGIDALYYIDSPRLRKLDLNCCTDIGYLFGGLLNHINAMQLKILVICQPRGQTGTGYVGRENIERFLMAHRGLEKLVLANLGQNRPCLPTILAQGRTLKILKLHESDIRHSSGTGKGQDANEMKDLTRVCQACPQLNNLIVDQACSGCGQRRFCLEGYYDVQGDNREQHSPYSSSTWRENGRVALHPYSVKVIAHEQVDCQVCFDWVQDFKTVLEGFEYRVT
ncbi:hypothetical protein N7G274_003399 [Stereocaulon virgatum]|uniref:Uncharacterized protein n=1 Tax=Stereocaulon virgatum TaxID=373712 RepID=A0ABR4AGP5_9LECA